MKPVRLWAVLALCLSTDYVFSFELATHAQITQQAYLQSNLRDSTSGTADLNPSFVTSLGIGSFVWGPERLTYPQRAVTGIRSSDSGSIARATCSTANNPDAITAAGDDRRCY